MKLTPTATLLADSSRITAGKFPETPTRPSFGGVATATFANAGLHSRKALPSTGSLVASVKMTRCRSRQSLGVGQGDDMAVGAPALRLRLAGGRRADGRIPYIGPVPQLELPI